MKNLFLILPLAFSTLLAQAATDVNCISADGNVSLETDWVRNDGELILKLNRVNASTLYFSAHPLTLNNNLVLIPKVGDNAGRQVRLSLGRMNPAQQYPRSKFVMTIEPHLGSDDRMTTREEIKHDLNCSLAGDIDFTNVCIEEDETVYGRWLLEASSEGDFEKVQQAVSCGADLNVVNESKCSSLMLAGIVSSKDCGKIRSPVIDSYRWARSEAIFKYLLEEGADGNLQDDRGESVAHKLVTEGMTQLLAPLSEAGGDINKQALLGMTPLMTAAITLNSNAVKALVGLGADLKKQNALGQTAYDLGEKLDPKVRALLKVDDSDGIVIQGSARGCTPLKINLPMGVPTKLTLKADTNSKFTMIQRNLGINLRAEAGKSATQTIEFNGMGTFKFECGSINGTRVTGQIKITM